MKNQIILLLSLNKFMSVKELWYQVNWKTWEATDKFLASCIKNLQARRTRLKKNVKNYLVNPKLFTI